jgi:hypothetical protein
MLIAKFKERVADTFLSAAYKLYKSLGKMPKSPDRFRSSIEVLGESFSTPGPSGHKETVLAACRTWKAGRNPAEMLALYEKISEGRIDGRPRSLPMERSHLAPWMRMQAEKDVATFMERNGWDIATIKRVSETLRANRPGTGGDSPASTNNVSSASAA